MSQNSAGGKSIPTQNTTTSGKSVTFDVNTK